MDTLSPITQNYMEDVNIQQLIKEEREARLCDCKIELAKFMELQNALFEEIYEENETKDLLIRKRNKLQILKNAYKQISV